MIRRSVIVWLTLSIVLASGCKHASDNQDTWSIVSLKGPSSMGIIHLIDSVEFLQKHHLVADILDEPNQIRSKLLREEPVLAMTPMNMASILYNRGLDYQLLAVPVWGTLYLFGADTSISSWEHLRGRKVNLMARGMTPDILFRYLLTKNNLIPDENVDLDYSFPTHIDLANAVASGRVELAVLSEPLVSLVQSKNNAVTTLLSLNNSWLRSDPARSDMPQTALLVNKTFADEHPDLIEEIIQIMNKSTRRVNEYTKAAATLIVKHKILPDIEIAESSIPGCNLEFRTANKAEDAIFDYLRVLHDFNPETVGGAIPDEGFIYRK